VVKKLNQFSANWINDGYLASGFDSIYFDSVLVQAYFYLGSKFLIDSLQINNIPQVIIKRTGFKKSFSKKKLYSLKQFLQLREEIVSYFEEVGYPFTQVKIDGLLLGNNGVKGELVINNNSYIQIDSLVIKGSPKIARKYLFHYIGLKKKEPYNQSKIDNLSKAIKELTYLQLAKPVEVEFREGKADVYLYLKNKPANFFNGIIGFASGTEENPDFQITGDLNLILVNAFKIGEQLEIYWNKYDENSQKLRLDFQFPYLFFLPIGIDFKFGLEKYNVDYLNTNLCGGIEYSFSAKNKVKAYFSQNNSYLIGNEQVEQGEFDESSRLTAGFTFLLDNTDYRFNPRQGLFIEASSGYGNRNTSLTGLSTILEFTTNFAYYLKLGNMGALALLNQSAGLYSDKGFYKNELFKIGGIKNLRGFDEHSIEASSYSVFSIEPRLLIGKNSAIYLFGDYSLHLSVIEQQQHANTC
jgi:outer membrane protein assembly factor BamA